MSNHAQKMGTRAPTVELDASVGNDEMYAYYVGGCCGLRSFYGFNGKSPAVIVEGIVMSGTSGCMMIFTDAYSLGKDAEAFKAYVDENKLGDVTITPPSTNLYTGKAIYGVVFGYQPKVLSAFVAKLQGKDAWTRPAKWHSTYDAVHMDSEFYQFGGRAKPANLVRASGIHVEEKGSE